MINPEKAQIEFKVGEKKFSVTLNSKTAISAQREMPGKTIFDFNLHDVEYVIAILFALCKGQNGVDSIDDACSLFDEDPVTCQKSVDEVSTLFFQKWTRKTT